MNILPRKTKVITVLLIWMAGVIAGILTLPAPDALFLAGITLFACFALLLAEVW